MNPLIALIVTELVRQGIPLGLELIRLFARSTAPTDADWESLRSKYCAKSYDGYIADARATKT